jgi:uncharacterized protein
MTPQVSRPVVWFEVLGRDGSKLRSFYSQLFGWQATDAPNGADYGLVEPAPPGIGGAIGSSQDGGPGHITFYVEVPDPAAALAEAERLGGKTILPPTEVPEAGLTFAYLADPEGHVVGLTKGTLR